MSRKGEQSATGSRASVRKALRGILNGGALTAKSGSLFTRRPYALPKTLTQYASRNTHCSSVFVLLHQLDQIAVRVVAEADADGAFGQLKVDRA